jgi:hypothetical protein
MRAEDIVAGEVFTCDRLEV